ncbi:hypothetical protein DM02DRAFT_678101 [Periconia macrospinosa]|uniref:Uncharacterized protein n=1 Tax=Periconia macrospinosa TaxID=97972 RepID=A0A2V1D082_9PLEO|nr:hypothetical protein DM02DRAFT_678101 [Periconia macrospinosa]
MDRACKIVPLEAFGPFLEFEVFSSHRLGSIFSTIRKTKCKEETENLLSFIVAQYEEITLGWNPSVVSCMDAESLKQLQSRAPLLSKEDFKTVSKQLQSGALFPNLADHSLRKRMEKAVCSQRLIMSIDTFASDIAVLHRVHKSVSNVRKVLGKRPKGSQLSLRENLLAFFREKDSSSALAPEHVARCYHHVFLHAMRTGRKNFIGFRQLEDLVSREFAGKSAQIWDGIETTGPVLDYDPLNEKELSHKNRHGNDLFTDESGMNLLYLDHFVKPHQRALCLPSLPFLRRELVSIFLFGTVSSAASDITYEKMLESTQSEPPLEIAQWSALSGTLVGRSVQSDESSTLVQHYETIDDFRDEKRISSPTAHRKVGVVRHEVTVASMAASVHNVDSSEPRSSSKRSLSGATLVARDKRARLTDDHSAKSPADSSSMVLISPRSSPWSDASHHRPSSGKSTASPSTIVNSSSIYTHCSHAHYILPSWPAPPSPRGRLPRVAREYRLLVQEEPFLSEQELLHLSSESVRASDEGIDANNQRLQAVSRGGGLLRKIQFRSLRLNIAQSVPANPESIRSFVANQKSIDSQSSFWYPAQDNAHLCRATDCLELIAAFRRRQFDVIWVDSVFLASTEVPSDYNFFT